MGLDMYLSRKDNLGNFHEVGYWRKANAIHGWFIENVQDGKDDRKSYRVSPEKIQKLYHKVSEAYDITRMGIDNIEVQESLAQILPTVFGFFFGSTRYDENYVEDLHLTIRIIESLDEDYDNLYYKSS